MQKLNTKHQAAGVENGTFLIEDLLVYVVHEITAANVLLQVVRGLEGGIRHFDRTKHRPCNQSKINSGLQPV